MAKSISQDALSFFRWSTRYVFILYLIHHTIKKKVYFQKGHTMQFDKKQKTEIYQKLCQLCKEDPMLESHIQELLHFEENQPISYVDFMEAYRSAKMNLTLANEFNAYLWILMVGKAEAREMDRRIIKKFEDIFAEYPNKEGGSPTGENAIGQ